MPRTKPARKEMRMAEFQSPEQSVIDGSVFQLNSIQRNIDSSFTSVNSDMEEIKLELWIEVEEQIFSIARVD